MFIKVSRVTKSKISGSFVVILRVHDYTLKYDLNGKIFIYAYLSNLKGGRGSERKKFDTFFGQSFCYLRNSQAVTILMRKKGNVSIKSGNEY